MNKIKTGDVIMANKFTDIELCCAKMDDIVEQMDFKIDIKDGQFALIDLQGAYWGNIGKDRFPDLELLLERLDIYIKDYFIDDMDELLAENDITELDKWDYTKTGIAFICSEKCSELRTSITPEVYKKFREKFLKTETPSKEDIRQIIPKGMIFYGDLWTGHRTDEFYNESDFETELSRITIFDKTIFDFSDSNILSKMCVH